VQIVKFFVNFALLHSKMAPNTTLLANVMVHCVKWTLMGLATFMTTHLSHDTAPGFINKCVAPFRSPWQSPQLVIVETLDFGIVPRLLFH
jgi:hypothetical protein